MDSAKSAFNELKHITLNGVEVLNRELGYGSYGYVFTVMYKGVVCAAKQINPLLTDNCSPEQKEKIKKDFIGECLCCSTIQHPNIVRFLGVFYTSERYRLPVMVMELMDTSLTTFVQENKSEIPFSKKVTIIYDVSQGLSFLHNREPQILHRDLSPNNVLLIQAQTNEIVAKVADLGVAKVVQTDNRHTKSKLTSNPGTKHFMPPEALLEENPEYGTPLDIFSFGGVALYVFTEEWPIPCAERMKDPDTKKLIALNEVERRQKYLKNMTGEAAELREMVEQCLNDDPVDRPSIQQVSTVIKPVKERQKVKESMNGAKTQVTSDQELMNAKKLFNEYNPKLVRFLPLKDPYFIAELTKQNLFSGNLKQEVMMTTITQADASANFLYKAIESALDIENKEPFNRLLQVMEKFDDLTLNQLATEIKQEITGGGDMKLESAIDDSGVPHMNISEQPTIFNKEMVQKQISLHEKSGTEVTDVESQSDSKLSTKSSTMLSNCLAVPPHGVSETMKPAVKPHQMVTPPTTPTPSQNSPLRTTAPSQATFGSFAEGLQTGNYNISWTRCAELPSPMYGASVAGDDETIYAAAGCAPNPNTYDYIFQYKIKSGQWNRIPSPGHNLGILCMIDGRLNVFGGHDAVDKSASNKVSTLIMDRKLWLGYYPNMINVRTKPGVVIYKDHIIVAGGARDKTTFNYDIEILNWQQPHLSWEQVDINLPVPMWAISLTVSDDYLYIVGYTQAKGRSASVYRIPAMAILEQLLFSNESPTDTWVKLCSAPHHDTNLIPYSNPLVVVGGNSHGKPTMEISFYSASENCWKSCALLSSARINVAVENLCSDTIIVVGGNTKGGTVEAAMGTSLTTVELGQLRRLN